MSMPDPLPSDDRFAFLARPSPGWDPEAIGPPPPPICHCIRPAHQPGPLAPSNGTPPSTHPVAADLVEDLARVCWVSGRDSLPPLEVTSWGQTAWQEAVPGWAVRWEGRVVLLATGEGEVWLWRHAADWELALVRLVADRRASV
jgi:hypothetical protein